MTERTNQELAAGTLLMLLLEDLPMCSWIVFPETGLEGHIVDNGMNDVIEDLKRWSDHLHVPVRRDAVHSRTVYVSGATASNVPVRVYAKDREGSYL
jgi:hypothetical protein